MAEFIFGNEKQILSNRKYTPIVAAFIIVESDKGFMLLHNKYRGVWELAGGIIENGESPKSCAIRECKEESNQDITDIKFFALSSYQAKGKNNFYLIYYSYLNVQNIFTENNEIKALRWWKPGEYVENMCDSSMEILNKYMSSEYFLFPKGV